jgi:flagellar biosynthesis protein FliR
MAIDQSVFGLLDPQAQKWSLTVGILVAARIIPLVLLAPWSSMRSFPLLVRAVVVVVLAVALTPCALDSAPQRCFEPLTLLAMAVRELAVGAVFALAASLPLYALKWAGQLTDTWRGASIAEVAAPISGERASPLGELYLLAGIVLFFFLGGHRIALSAFANTLSSYPVGGSLGGGGLSATIWGSMRLFADAFTFAAMVAAPVGAVLILTEVALGLVGRIAPQIAASLATVPLRAVLGLSAALCALSYCLSHLGPVFREAIEKASALIRMLGQ